MKAVHRIQPDATWDYASIFASLCGFRGLEGHLVHGKSTTGLSSSHMPRSRVIQKSHCRPFKRVRILTLVILGRIPPHKELTQLSCNPHLRSRGSSPLSHQFWGRPGSVSPAIKLIKAVSLYGIQPIDSATLYLHATHTSILHDYF